MGFNLFPMYTWEDFGEITSANDAFLALLRIPRRVRSMNPGASTGAT
jgi:hypothetical protein